MVDFLDQFFHAAKGPAANGATGIPRIDRIRRSPISRGDPPRFSTHLVKSVSLTSCSTRTCTTETLTTLSPWEMPATHSLPRIAASPWATASAATLYTENALSQVRSHG